MSCKDKRSQGGDKIVCSLTFSRKNGFQGNCPSIVECNTWITFKRNWPQLFQKQLLFSRKFFSDVGGEELHRVRLSNTSSLFLKTICCFIGHNYLFRYYKGETGGIKKMIENCVQVKDSKKSQFDATITLLQTLRGRREIKEVITTHACHASKTKKYWLFDNWAIWRLCHVSKTKKKTSWLLGDCVTFQKLRNTDFSTIVQLERRRRG